MITDKSGKSRASSHWINSRLDLKNGELIDKRHPGISEIHKWVLKQYEGGRMTSISHEEMEKMVRKFLPELFMSDLEKIKYRAAQAAVAVVSR